jgi:hypothetical protein
MRFAPTLARTTVSPIPPAHVFVVSPTGASKFGLYLRVKDGAAARQLAAHLKLGADVLAVQLAPFSTNRDWAADIPADLATSDVTDAVRLSAIAATVPDASVFRNGREFAAWLGLVPRQNSTGGKTRLGRISKRGDGYLRRLLVNGAHAVLLRSKAARTDPWLQGLRGRRPRLVVAVAIANKTARVAWALMTKQENYRRAAAAA